ncbi:MAG: hypothetical protein EOP49_24365 [Sphingobacteriales bacterium]|nr:MAG: hypothetical protein EOP49_24365 [Sphingobacteriales bacterium]
MPLLLLQTQKIDADDVLASIVKDQLETWHYSGIGAELDCSKMAFEAILGNECLHQLYIDRVIKMKDHNRAMLPELAPGIAAALGIYAAVFWKELKLQDPI